MHWAPRLESMAPLHPELSVGLPQLVLLLFWVCLVGGGGLVRIRI